MTISADELRRLPLLEGLHERELRRLATQMHGKSYRPGDVVVQEGTRGIGFSFVIDGEAEVTVRGRPRARLAAGDYFGELALLAPDQGRQATVVAKSELTCASITAWEFKPLLKEHPEVAWQLLRDLARRSAAVEEQRAGEQGGDA